MARYLKLFTIEPRLYASGSPVIIESGALHKDNALGDIVLQLKFRSLSRVDISALTVDATCFDAAQQVVTSNFVYQYTNIIKDEACEFFGQKTLITLPDVSTRSVVVRVSEVKFSDGSSVSVDNKDWESIPEQAELANFAPDLEKYLKDKYGEKSKVVPTEYKDLWLCICGQENKKENSNCAHCDVACSSLLPFDIESEDEEWKRIDEEKRIKSKKTRKLAGIIAGAVTTLVCIVVAFVVILNSVIIPNGKYYDAVELMKQKKYTQAIEMFKELYDYKDSVNKIEECYIGMYSEEGWKILKNLMVGDTIKFGSYRDDFNGSKRKIDWIVLKIDGSKVFVISEKILDKKTFHDSYQAVTWETCSLRKWLNNEFFDCAFSESEKKKIETVKVTADIYREYPDRNPGNDTEDKIFLLSAEEEREYSKYTEEIIISDYVDSLTPPGYFVSWWLRSPSGSNEKCVAVRSWKGFVDDRRSDSVEGIRPAMWIDLSK